MVRDPEIDVVVVYVEVVREIEVEIETLVTVVGRVETRVVVYVTGKLVVNDAVVVRVTVVRAPEIDVVVVYVEVVREMEVEIETLVTVVGFVVTWVDVYVTGTLILLVSVTVVRDPEIDVVRVVLDIEVEIETRVTVVGVAVVIV